MVDEKKGGQYVWDEVREKEIGGNKFRKEGVKLYGPRSEVYILF